MTDRQKHSHEGAVERETPDPPQPSDQGDGAVDPIVLEDDDLDEPDISGRPE